MKRKLYGILCMAPLWASLAWAEAPPVAKIDSMAQRMAACMACHGAEGRAGAEGYLPRIAGKPEGYLYNQLINFRQGKRLNPAMRRMVEHLPDAYLKEIAAYFASQHLPYPAPQKATVTSAQLAQGRSIVMEGDMSRKIAACVSCHGQKLTGIAPAIPGLLGLPRDYVTQQLSAWRQGTRRAAAPDCMAHVAKRLSPSDIVAASAWLSTQPVETNFIPEAALTTRLPLKCGGIQ